MRALILTGLLLAPGLIRSATAAAVKTPHVTAELIVESGTLRPGEIHWIGVRLELEQHWHVYWRNPGDSGLPVSVKWALPDGFTVGDLVWPAPERLEEGPLVSFGHSGSVLLMAPLTVPAHAAAGGAAVLRATVKWLVCKDTCIPGSADVTVSVPPGAGRAGPHAARFAAARKRAPQPMPADWHASAAASGKSLTLIVAGAPAGGPAFFFPHLADLIDHAAPQKPIRGRDGLQLDLTLSDRVAFVPPVVEGVLRIGDRAWALSVPATSTGGSVGTAAPAADSGGPTGFLWAVLFAFLGGTILNLMPCVFPVLSIKILGFVRESESHPREVRIHGLLYGAGVIVSFWALAAALFALKAGGAKLGWGFQLQSPAVIYLLTATLFFLSLNLLGVFEAGTTIARAAGSAKWGEGRGAAFFTGVLATFLATPCTAPFMGTAVGYAAVQPAHIGFGVFTALAAGMAAPYVVLSYVPHVGAMLPKPGRWMETFKHLMAFPLLATVIWLLWVLGLQAGLKIVIVTLGSLLLIGMAGWLYGRWRSGASRMVCGALVAVALGVSLVSMRGATADSVAATGEWQPWSEAGVAAARAAGRPVFVDFTAAWCLTCKVNEAVALHTDDVRRALKERNVALFRADWTNADPAIERALAAFGRNGVPLYVLYPADPAAPPRLLPQILTPGIVLDGLDGLASPAR